MILLPITENWCKKGKLSFILFFLSLSQFWGGCIICFWNMHLFPLHFLSWLGLGKKKSRKRIRAYIGYLKHFLFFLYWFPSLFVQKAGNASSLERSLWMIWQFPCKAFQIMFFLVEMQILTLSCFSLPQPSPSHLT